VIATTKKAILVPENLAKFPSDHEALGYAPCLVALLQAVARKKSVADLVTEWRGSAKQTPWSTELSPWFDSISESLSQETGGLCRLLESGSPPWDQRAIIALQVCTAPDASPRQLAIAQYQLLVSFAGDAVWRRRSRDGIIKLLCSAARRLIQSPALLSNPRLNIPKLESAMKSSATGYQKAAEIMIATFEICGLKPTSQILDQLRALRE